MLERLQRSKSLTPQRSFDPPTPVEFEIMLALADGERHGYAIMQEVERRTGGAIRLRPGTLYRAINRMRDAGMLEEITNRPNALSDDRRRRYFRLSESGQRVATDEAQRLADVVCAAEAKHLIPHGAGHAR
jgi:DNA-binding PadR family transcriptional regulator